MHNSPRHPFFINYRHRPENLVALLPHDQELDTDLDHSPYNKADSDHDAELEAAKQAAREAAMEAAYKQADPVAQIIWNRYKQPGANGKSLALYFGVPYSYIRRQIKTFKLNIINNVKK